MLINWGISAMSEEEARAQSMAILTDLPLFMQ
jgi:hypothetical protein